ncbi:MAG TPA: hypothetical protein VNJ52_05420 [Patescibacteria group bacterium]|nr:hypothetical protein [Patescibacteria group bacterium]
MPQDQAQAIPAQFPAQKVAEALEKVADPEAKLALSVALSRTSFGFGPDPETAKIISETEIHEENCRLDGYKASLANRDKQNERDHDYRKRRLNRDFTMSLSVLVLASLGAAFGLYLVVAGSRAVGSNVLIASIGVILYVLKGSSEVFKQ